MNDLFWFMFDLTGVIFLGVVSLFGLLVALLLVAAMCGLAYLVWDCMAGGNNQIYKTYWPNKPRK